MLFFFTKSPIHYIPRYFVRAIDIEIFGYEAES